MRMLIALAAVLSASLATAQVAEARNKNRHAVPITLRRGRTKAITFMASAPATTPTIVCVHKI